MKIQEKTKDELLEELQILKQENSLLKAGENIQRMAKMLDVAPNSITVHDFNGAFLYANQKTFDMHGYTREEFLSLPLDKLDTPETAKQIPTRMKEILEKGEASFEVEHFKKDGTILPMDVYALTTRWGDTNAMLSIASDITQRKAAEKALRLSEEKFRALYKAIPIPTYTWQQAGEDLVLIDYNDAALTFTYGEVEKHIRIMASQMYKDNPTIMDELMRCLHEKTVIKRDMEYKFQFSDHTKFLHVNYAYVPPDFVMVHSEDFTEIMMAEAALKKSEILLVNTASIGKVGGWEINIDTLEQTWTDEIYTIHEVDKTFKPTVEKGVGFYTPESRQIIERAINRAIEFGETFNEELEIVTAKGNHRWVKAIGEADLKNRSVFGFFQDITEIRTREAELLKKTMELENLNSYFINRELRMVELKKEINNLLQKAGMEKRYPVS